MVGTHHAVRALQRVEGRPGASMPDVNIKVALATSLFRHASMFAMPAALTQVVQIKPCVHYIMVLRTEGSPVTTCVTARRHSRLA